MRSLFLITCLLTTALLSAESFQTIGTLKPSAHSQLGCQVSGTVEAIFVDIGDPVKKNQPLIKLATILLENDYAQKHSLLEASQIELQDAQLNFERMQKLWEKADGTAPSISRKRYEEAQIRLKQAGIQVKQAQEAMQRTLIFLDDATIKAPFDGIVTGRFVDPGESVTTTPSTEVVEIQAIDPLFLEFSIPQDCLSWVRLNTPLTFVLQGSLNEKQPAVLDRIYPFVDEATYSVKCRAIVDNKEKKFRPGSLVKVELQHR